jgi:hypothetical protein
MNRTSQLPQVKDVGFVIYPMVGPNMTLAMRLISTINVGYAMQQPTDAHMAQCCYRKGVSAAGMARHTKRG